MSLESNGQYTWQGDGDVMDTEKTMDRWECKTGASLPETEECQELLEAGLANGSHLGLLEGVWLCRHVDFKLWPTEL